jgi:hypothetical protein
MGHLFLVPFLGHIKLAVAAAIFSHIRPAIHTRTDNVLIPMSILRRQPARAAHVAIAFFVDQQPLQEIKNPLFISIKIVALGLLAFL